MNQNEPINPAHDILEEAAQVMRDRHAIYGRNDLMIGKVMEVLFPNGVQLVTPADHRAFHMMGQVVGKLTRFAASGMKHKDSIHDAINYCAILENEVEAHDIVVLRADPKPRPAVSADKANKAVQNLNRARRGRAGR